MVSKGASESFEAKIKPSKIVFWWGKQKVNLNWQLKKVLLINIESENEAKLIDKISKK